MTYYYEVKEKLDKEKLGNNKNFPIYDPLKNRNNFYLDIQKQTQKAKEIQQYY